MKAYVRTLQFVVIAVLALFLATTTSSPVAAHYPGVRLTGWGTATINGVLSPGEWDGAGHIDFQTKLPPEDGGGTTPVTLFVMNNATNLYLGLKIARPSVGAATNVGLQFDNDHDGSTLPEPGDDGFGMSVGVYQALRFYDIYYYRGGPSAIYSAYDTESTRGILPPGTQDGSAGVSTSGQFTYIEMSHPLNSADDAHDFSLRPGQTVGFQMYVNLFTVKPRCSSESTCRAITYFPTESYYGFNLGDIVIAAPPPPSAKIQVYAALQTVKTEPGQGLKLPLALNLKVFDKAKVGAPDPKNYAKIWNSTLGLVSSAQISPPSVARIGGGQANLYTIWVPASGPSNQVTSGSYLIIGKARVGGIDVYVGSPTDKLAPNSTTQKHLQVILNSKGQVIATR